MFLKRIFFFTVLAWAWSGSAAADYVFVFYEQGTRAGVYDADTLELAAMLDVGAGARQVVGVPDADDPTRFVKIYIVHDNAVQILEPEPPFATIDNRLLTQPVNPGESPALLTPDARWLLVPNGNTLLAFNAQDPTGSSFQRVNFAADQLIDSVFVDPNGDHAYLVIAESTDMRSVDLRAAALRRVAGPIVLPEVPAAVALAPSGAGLYAVSSEGLHDIDFHTGTVRGTLPLDLDRRPARFFAFDSGSPLNRVILTHGDIVSLVTIETFTREFGAAPPFAVDKVLAPSRNRLFLLNRAAKQIFEHVIGEKDFDALRDPRTQAALRPSILDMQFDLAAQNLFILGEENLLRFSADAASFGASAALPSAPSGFFVLSTAGMTADTVEVYGGNNQDAESSGFLQRPLAVRVTDSAGVPVFGAEIAFSSESSSPSIAFDPPDTVTNRFGIAVSRVRIPSDEDFSIQAQTEDGRQAAFELNTDTIGRGALVVLSGDFQSAPENSPLPRSIRVQIVSAGVGLPNTDFTITTSNESVDCPSTTRTGSNGITSFQCRSGESTSLRATTTRIDVEDAARRRLAEPVTIRVASNEENMPRSSAPRRENRDTIRGVAGETLEGAVELSVILENGRAPRPGIAVEFETDNNVTLIPHIAPSDSDGIIRADAQLGCRPGQGFFTASLSVPGLPDETFAYEILPGPASEIDILQGDHQSGQPGELLNGPGQALLARIVNSCGDPFPNTPAAWEVIPPDAATLENQVRTSNRNGEISALVRMGSRPGDFSVVVSTDGDNSVSATFHLAVAGPPAPTISMGGFVNGASFAPGWTPGSLGSIFGTGLLPGVEGVVQADEFPFPRRLRGISVLVNGTPAPIFSLANSNGQEQINIQVPFSTPAPANSVDVVIESGGLSHAFTGPRTSVVQPGIFEYTLPAGRFAAALHTDYSLVQPTNPARPGEIVSLFFTGGGPVDPAVPTNAPGPAPIARTEHPASVTLDGVAQESSGDFLGSFYAPSLVSVYQLNFRIGEDTPAGNREIRIAQSGVQSQTSLLPVQR